MSRAAPSPAAPPAPHPAAPPPGTELPEHYAGCVGCGRLEGSLRLRFTAGEGLAVSGTFTVRDHHQGAPGLAHGGTIATAFDEAFGALLVLVGEPAVTASLQTEFRRPVPVGAVLHLDCRVEGREGRKLWVSGSARLDAPDGPTAAQATALFVIVPEEHFTRHGGAKGVDTGRAVNP